MDSMNVPHTFLYERRKSQPEKKPLYFLSFAWVIIDHLFVTYIEALTSAGMCSLQNMLVADLYLLPYINMVCLKIISLKFGNALPIP